MTMRSFGWDGLRKGMAAVMTACCLAGCAWAVAPSQAAAAGAVFCDGNTCLILPERPEIRDWPLAQTEKRDRLNRAYSLEHYGQEITTIDPKAIVVHWTASPDKDGVYRYFYPESVTEDGKETLNVASQFLVDRDGTIYRLLPETMLARHSIGYNWCAIGIENVGGVGDREDLTREQLIANLVLIRYLKGKYPGITHCWGHYQQKEARESGLYKELVPGYFHEKVDPGPDFMTKLQHNLEDTGLVFYKP